MSKEKIHHNPLKAQVISLSKDGLTAKVEVPSVVLDKKYGKRLHRVIRLHVHVDRLHLKVGEITGIMPCRRISKTKSWRAVPVQQTV